MLPGDDEASGRFIGGKAFLKAAAELGAELPASSWQEELDLLEALERWGALVPVFRYRVADPIRVRRHTESYPASEEPSLPAEADTPRLAALLELERRLSHWRHAGMVGMAPHPFDDPLPDEVRFMEDPASAPLQPGAYRPIVVGRQRDGSPLLDDKGAFPVYRRWQALHLAEFLRGGVRLLQEPTENLVADMEATRHPDADRGLRERFIWHAHQDVDGFATHRPSLEAVSWFETYSQRALDLAEGRRGPEGGTIISGAPWEELLREETRIAGDALSRHVASEADVVAMLDWAARKARRHAKGGRPSMEAAYRDVALHAVRLLRSLDIAFDDIGGRMPSGRELLDELFPDWLTEQRRTALFNLVKVVLPRWTGQLEGVLAIPGEAECSAFLGWLEKEGLFQLYWHFETFRSLHGRLDEQAKAAVQREVLGMSAFLEHVLNTLGTTKHTMRDKMYDLWKGCAAVAGRFGQSKALANARTETEFRNNVVELHARLRRRGGETVVRELLEAALIRNMAQHRALAFMDKTALTEAFLTLLRASFLCWLLVRPDHAGEVTPSDDLPSDTPDDDGSSGGTGT